jgi:hypothetical protein
VGIEPGVALAMARLGTTLHQVLTALDLDGAVELLDRVDVPPGVDDTTG